MLKEKPRPKKGPSEKFNRRLLDLLKYRSMFGKKRTDDDITDLAIKQWLSEGKNCDIWKLK